jgi:SAM-dependent methyltransferase
MGIAALITAAIATWKAGGKRSPKRWSTITASKPATKILDVGCGKGFLLYDFTKVVPGVELYGIDISTYAIANAKEEIKDRLQVGNANVLPFPDHHFDLVYSLNTLHNLHSYDLDPALREIERVGKKNKYICVESYRNEVEKANLLYWQVTCEAFNTPEEWPGGLSKPGIAATTRLSTLSEMQIMTMPTTMKAAVLVGQREPLVIADVALPSALLPGQVLVKVHCSGICGSQLGEIDGAKGADKFLPHLLGHEGSGTVVEIGPTVRHVKTGDKVVLHWRKGLGIEASPPQYQWNGKVVNAGWITTFNEYAIVAENRVTPIPADSDMDVRHYSVAP